MTAGRSDWRQALEGDAEAFGRVYDQYKDRVFGHALRSVRNRVEAEDVTAIVFLEAWRKRRSVREVDGSILGWLLVTTNNVVRNIVRSARRHREALMRLPPPDSAPGADAEVEDAEQRSITRHTVASAFRALGPRDQDVLTLCVLEELSVHDAAKALGVPDGTVKSRLSRAKRKLAASLTSDVTL